MLDRPPPDRPDLPALSNGHDVSDPLETPSLSCARAHGLIGRLFQTHAAQLSDGSSPAQREQSLTWLRASLLRQLQLHEEILLPGLLQAITSHRRGDGPSARDRALFEHVQADHAGCLALLDELPPSPPSAPAARSGPGRESVVAVLEAYVLPHLSEIAELCTRLAAAGIDTRAVGLRMAQRRLELGEPGQPTSQPTTQPTSRRSGPAGVPAAGRPGTEPGR